MNFDEVPPGSVLLVNHNMKHLLILAAICFSLSSATAAEIKGAETFSLAPSASNRAVGEQTFQATRGSVTRSIRLPIRLVDWRIDCSETRAVVWGPVTYTLPTGSQPFAKVFIIDVARMSILNSYSVTRGPYDARFAASRKRIAVDDTLLDFDTGGLIHYTSGRELDFEAEDSAACERAGATGSVTNHAPEPPGHALADVPREAGTIQQVHKLRDSIAVY